MIAIRNDEELRIYFGENVYDEHISLPMFANNTLTQFLRAFLLTGTMQDEGKFQDRLRELIGEATFLEAYHHTGKMYRPQTVS